MENSPSVNVESTIWLTFVPRVNGKLFCSSALSVSSSAFGWFLRKFEWLEWLSNRQFSFTQYFVKHWVLHDFSYLRVVKYTSLEFFQAYPCEILLEESKPTLSIAFTKFFINPNLICMGGSSIFGSTRRRDWTLCEPGFNLCLNDHSCLI